jgi:hypothetical protein
MSVVVESKFKVDHLRRFVRDIVGRLRVAQNHVLQFDIQINTGVLRSGQCGM